MATSNFTTPATGDLTPQPTPKPTTERSGRVFLFTVEPRVEVTPDATETDGVPGLAQLLAYIDANPTTTRLVPQDSPTDDSNAHEVWHVPFADGRTTRSMGGEYLLRARTAAESHLFEEALRGDPRVREVHRPPAYRQKHGHRPRARAAAATVDTRPAGERARPHATVAGVDVAAVTAHEQWGLVQCGFPEVWDSLDVGKDPGPIAMIDIGSHRGHPEIADRIVEYHGPLIGAESIADHAAAVAAIISARRHGRGALNGEDMDGCCSASIVLYNVWTRDQGISHETLYRALRNAIDRKLPVVNMSIWVEEPDAKLARLLAECEANNVVVVAAMGNSGDDGQVFHPAADPYVIAVAATDPAGNRHEHSSVGDHVFIAAPGENILTVVGDDAYDRVSGTSFAAAFVTAAVWLAKRKRPGLTNAQLRDLLSKSVVPTDRPRELGHGRLDMRRLELVLPTIP